MDLLGKSYQEIETALDGVKRDRMIAIVCELASAEPFFSPEQVARLRGVSRETVMRRIRTRRMRAHLPAANKYRIPLSELRKWDLETMLS